MSDLLIHYGELLLALVPHSIDSLTAIMSHVRHEVGH